MTETPKLSQALDMLDILLADTNPGEHLEIVMRQFVEAVNAGEAPDRRLLDAVASAWEAGDLIHHWRTKGRPAGRHEKESRDFDRAVSVVSLMGDRDLKRKAAIYQVAENRGEKFGTVEKAYDKHKVEARKLYATLEPVFEKARRFQLMMARVGSKQQI